MRILFLTGYIYESALPQFNRNKSGFGMMVNDIIRYVSNRKNETFLLTHVVTKDEYLDSAHILKHTWKDVFLNASLLNITKGIRVALLYGNGLKLRLKYIYYYMNAGYVKKCINAIKPDIVHIHGIGYSTQPFIDVCKEMDIPYVVTLHGLIGLNDEVKATYQDKKLEQVFLKDSENENIPVTVISSGIKKRIIKNYGVNTVNHIYVIPNGTNISNKIDEDINIREKYKIPSTNKIAVCIGNLSDRKNQIQIIKAYDKMSSSLKRNLTILFIGNDNLGGKLQKTVNELSYDNNIIFCGFVEKNFIASYISQADINIVASLDEGFGLSIIESFVQGVPTITFSDLDAVEDVYSDKAMKLVNERSDEALAFGIEEALQIKWNRNWIQQYSNRFSLERMAEKYQNCYSEVLEKRVK